jgi:hypothetical protein
VTKSFLILLGAMCLPVGLTYYFHLPIVLALLIGVASGRIGREIDDWLDRRKLAQQ